MSKQRAFISGIAGQDGSYLAEFLLEKKYDVVGLVRSYESDCSRIVDLKDSIKIEYGNVLDTAHMLELMKKYEPTEIYHLASKSFVPASWSEPLLTADVTAMGVTSMLEAFRVGVPKAKFFQASSSEMFGNVPQSPQNEGTPFLPQTPYGASKVYGHFMTTNYRRHYNLHACSGIMYNHESIRRDIRFVTRKITSAVAKIKLGLENVLKIGNTDVSRDWGFAGDYVEAMWLQLQSNTPTDYVIATGTIHTVKQLLELAFSSVGLEWSDFVIVDPKFCRAPEKNILVGDISKIKKELGWCPQVSFEKLITEMVQFDLDSYEKLGKKSAA